MKVSNLEKLMLIQPCATQVWKGTTLILNNLWGLGTKYERKEILKTILKPASLQRQNAENFKQMFPEKEYRALGPNFHIHVSVSELYIPTMGLPVLLEEIRRLILGIYK